MEAGTHLEVSSRLFFPVPTEEKPHSEEGAAIKWVHRQLPNKKTVVRRLFLQLHLYHFELVAFTSSNRDDIGHVALLQTAD